MHDMREYRIHKLRSRLRGLRAELDARERSAGLYRDPPKVAQLREKIARIEKRLTDLQQSPATKEPPCYGRPS